MGSNLLNEDDFMTILNAELLRKGFAGHHIESMNEFYSTGVKQIITEAFAINSSPFSLPKVLTKDVNNPVEAVVYEVNFTDAYVTPTTIAKYNTNERIPITPNDCRRKNMSYTCDLYVSLNASINMTHQNGLEHKISTTINDIKIGQIPCMVGSNMCITHKMNHEMLKGIGEDPCAPGGYFILNGKEWVVDNLENMSLNTFHVFKQDYENEISRGNILSKQGDKFENSYQLILKHLEGDKLVVVISQLTTAGSKTVDIPFYVLFRALGMTSDKDIYDHILQGETNEKLANYMIEVLYNAFNAKYKDAEDIADDTSMNGNVLFLANKQRKDIKQKMTEEMKRYAYQRCLDTIDLYILPHVGKTPESRIKKAMFLAHMFRELLLVSAGVQESTDRDSYKIKRIHSAGVSIAKVFKTLFNSYIIKDLNNKLRKLLESGGEITDSKLENSIRSVIENSDIMTGMRKAITVGSDKLYIKNQEVNRHISAQQLHHKNDINVKSTLNTITAAISKVKQNERADNMRRVHPTFNAKVCVTQSADTGIKVGTNKLMAIAASVSPNISSQELKDIIIADTDYIIPIHEIIPTDIVRNNLTKVFVNGDWLGCCRNAKQFVEKYKTMRRNGEIHFTISIVWEVFAMKINFWTDAGRLLSPYMIVYNNDKEYLESKGKVQFEQYIKFTKEHADKLRSGELTIDDLRREQIIEYLSCDEASLIAHNYDILMKYKNDPTRPYTHCDINQSVLGLVALASPLGNHSNAVRNTMYTNHRRQSCGWYALNYPDRMDKDASLQHYCNKPIVTTFSDNYVSYPNGQIPMVALQLYNGWGQEDSIIINKNSVDVGMFSVSYYTYYDSTLDKHESWGVNPSITSNLKTKNYSKLDGNFIRLNEVVERDDVLIAKSERIQKDVTDYSYIDRSVKYNKDEICYVVDRIIPERGNDITVAKIKLESTRYLDVGAKLSSRTGNKGIVSKLIPREDMPYTSDGIVPDMIVNPHSIPTRMANNQILEATLGWLSLITGKTIDATIFKKLDIDNVCDMLAKLGFESNGYHTMYDGKTGKKMQVQIFMGPTTYQRLQKFIQDEHYAIHTGPYNNTTHQPLSGKANNGGLKIGEMEVWALAATGSMQFMYEKIYKDSDKTTIYICRICGNRAVVNEEKNIYICKICKDKCDITSVNSSWMTNVMLNEISAMNLHIETYPKPYEFVIDQE